MRVRGPIRKVVSVGHGRSEGRPCLGAKMQRVISVYSSGPRDSGGGMTVLDRGGRGREIRVVLLALVVDCPDPSPVPSRCPW